MTLTIRKIYNKRNIYFSANINISLENHLLDIYELKIYDIIGETRDLKMEHANSIDFMLKSSFFQLFIECPLTVHS